MNNNGASGRIILDTRGTFCPIPVVKISEAIKNVDAGVVVEMIADDPAIEYDLPAWCKSAGHKILSLEREGGDFRFEVLKTGDD
jgi:tRNA 2-thiouridine synthesizing protein A